MLASVPCYSSRGCPVPFKLQGGADFRKEIRQMIEKLTGGQSPCLLHRGIVPNSPYPAARDKATFPFKVLRKLPKRFGPPCFHVVPFSELLAFQHFASVWQSTEYVVRAITMHQSAAWRWDIQCHGWQIEMKEIFGEVVVAPGFGNEYLVNPLPSRLATVTTSGIAGKG